jgi:hypothetical protein
MHHHAIALRGDGQDKTMTTKVLGIDLHDAGRDGVYRVDPDDPTTLIDDAARAGLPVTRVDLSPCHDTASLLAAVAGAARLPDGQAAASWRTLDQAFRAAAGHAGSGHVMLFDHANALRKNAPEAYAEALEKLKAMAREWHARGVPFFVFMEFPDNETRDAAIDA